MKMVDLKFIDLPGIWQHFTVPISEFDHQIFVEGLGFDGSSIRGFRSINESDMVLIPDLQTAFIDPFDKDMLDTWIAYKIEKEVDAIRLRPHPYEFMLYYDI